MNPITFGKERYHENEAMRDWCHTYIGKGGWKTNALFDAKQGIFWAWHCDSMFGNTTFYFSKNCDASLFALRWM